MKLYCLRDR